MSKKLYVKVTYVVTEVSNSAARDPEDGHTIQEPISINGLQTSIFRWGVVRDLGEHWVYDPNVRAVDDPNNGFDYYERVVSLATFEQPSPSEFASTTLINGKPYQNWWAVNVPDDFTIPPDVGSPTAGNVGEGLINDAAAVATAILSAQGIAYAGVLGAINGSAQLHTALGTYLGGQIDAMRLYTGGSIDAGQFESLIDANSTAFGLAVSSINGVPSTIIAALQAINVVERAGNALVDYRDVSPSDSLTAAFVGSMEADVASGSIRDDIFAGGLGDDVLSGNGGNDVLLGGSGEDVLDGGAGRDLLRGGAGDDTYFVDSSQDRIVEPLAAGEDSTAVSGDTVSSLVNWSLGANLENLTLTGTAALTGSGNALDNRIMGNAGANVLNGGDGNDYLDGGRGADQLVGGKGDDTYMVDSASDVIVEAAGGGSNDIMRSTVSTTIAANVEVLQLIDPVDLAHFNGFRAINGTGNTANNRIEGSPGNNVLDGRGGADTLIGGYGDDTYIVDNPGDVVHESGFPWGGGHDTVHSSVTFELPSNVEVLSLTGAAPINGHGNDGDNTLTGNAAANRLEGLNGNDILNGGAGKDTMIGATGDDTYVVDHLQDTVTELADEGADVVQTALSYVLPDHVENLVLLGTSATTGTGNALGNSITGNAAANILTGGAGDDTLNGGRGNDTLTGGPGADRFRFAAQSGVDTILDFNPLEDRIDLLTLGSVETVADLNIVQQGADTVLTFSSGNRAILRNVQASELTASHFIFSRGDTSYYDSVGNQFAISLSSSGSGGSSIGGPAPVGDLFAPQVIAAPDLYGNKQFWVYFASDRTVGTGPGAYFWDFGAEIVTFDPGANAVSVQYGTGFAVDVVGAFPGSSDFDVTQDHSGYGSIVWYDKNVADANGLVTSHAQLTGSPPRFQVNLQDFEGQLPAVAALGGGRYALTWTSAVRFGSPQPVSDGDSSSVVMMIVNPDNTTSVPTVVNSTTAGMQSEGEIAAAGDGSFVIVWDDQDAHVRGQRYSNAGARIGTEFRVDTQDQSGILNPNVVVLENGGFLVYWTALSHPLSENVAVLGRLYGANGVALGSEFLISDDPHSQQHGPSIAALPGGGFIAAWTDTSGSAGINTGADVRLQTFDAGGARVGGAYYVNTTTAGDQYRPSISYLGDDLVAVVWENAATSSATGTTLWGQVVRIGSNAGGGGGGGTATAASVQKLWQGTAADDTIAGDVLDDVVDGGPGNDRLMGGPGQDLIVGGAGVDTVSYEDQVEAVTVRLAEGTATGPGSGNDRLVGVENAIGGAGSDLLVGDAGLNRLDGRGGDDLIQGLRGADVLIGGAGNDTVSYADSPTAVTVDLAAASAQRGGDAEGDSLSGFENVTGSAFSDVLAGNALANALSGGLGNDRLLAGTGDTLDGGGGTDVASYAASRVGVVVDLDLAGPQASGGDASGNVLVGIEDLVGSSFSDRLSGNAFANRIEGGGGSDLVDGDDGNDVLIGGGGNDTLQGGYANDVLLGGPGADLLDGGDGIDVVSYAGSLTSITIRLGHVGAGAGDAPLGVGGDAQGDRIINVEHIVCGSGHDRLTGNSLNNLIDGGAGNDLLAGLAGADTLIGGGGIDTATYGESAAGVTVDLESLVNGGGDADGDVLSAIENLTGSNFDDQLTGDGAVNALRGNGGNDALSGGGGNDTLLGGDGDDTLAGGLGDDVLNAGTGANGGTGDTVSYADMTAAVTVNLAITVQQNTGGAGKDTLTGFENLTGGGGNDVLTGNTGANVIAGGAGNDTLTGGVGADTLTGGSDDDVFRFGNPAHGADQITDFTAREDHIGIGRAGFGIASGVSLTGSGANDFAAHYFVDGTAPTESGHGQFLFDDATHQLFWDPDGTGSTGRALIATLSNGAGLTAADFLLLP